MTDQIQVESFSTHPEAFLRGFRPILWIYYTSLILYWVFPPLSLAFALLSAFLFTGHFLLYFGLLDFMFPKAESTNVIANLEPLGKARSTLIFAGHMDSAYEFTWWKKLKTFGLVLQILGGILIVIINPILMIIETAYWGGDSIPNAVHYFYLVVLGLSPLTLLYYFWHNYKVVPGAQDNLSGVAISLAVFKSLADETEPGLSILKNTRIRFISFGSEEAGIKGSKHYAKKHLEELKKEKALLINLDGIRKLEFLTIINREIMIGVKHKKELNEQLKESFIESGQPPQMGMIPIGATDAAAFDKVGLPATTIIGVDNEKLDFTYHTRYDTPENLEEKALTKLTSILVRFAKNWDEKTIPFSWWK